MKAEKTFWKCFQDIFGICRQVSPRVIKELPLPSLWREWNLGFSLGCSSFTLKMLSDLVFLNIRCWAPGCDTWIQGPGTFLTNMLKKTIAELEFIFCLLIEHKLQLFGGLLVVMNRLQLSQYIKLRTVVITI